MSKFTQKHAQISFCSNFKEQNSYEIWLKRNPPCRNMKNKPKNQANSNQNKPKNKQLARLQKKPQIHKKTSPNSRENRKVGNTDGALNAVSVWVWPPNTGVLKQRKAYNICIILSSWILSNYCRSTTSNASGKDTIFAKNSSRYVSQQSAQLWNLQSIECRPTSPNRVASICGQNVHGDISEAPSPAGYTHVMRPTDQPSNRRSDSISKLAWSRLRVEPTELSEIAENREVFQALLRLLSPRPSQDEKWVWKWMNK